MANIRFTVTIKGKPGEDILFAEVLRVGQEAYRFLRSLGADLGLDLKGDNWVAMPPTKGSYVHNIAYRDEVPVAQANSFATSLGRVTNFKPKRTKLPAKVRRETVIQYAKIGEQLKHNESVRIGAKVVGASKARSPVSGEISHARSVEILHELEQTVAFYRGFQGTIHSLNIGSSPPFFQLRELSTGDLVKCEYKDEHYSKVLAILEEPGAVVLVSGDVSASREPRSIESVQVARMEKAPQISDNDFQSFFGSAPDITGELSTDEFLDRIWRDE